MVCRKFTPVTLQEGVLDPPDWVVKYDGAEVTQLKNSDPTLAYGKYIPIFVVSK